MNKYCLAMIGVLAGLFVFILLDMDKESRNGKVYHSRINMCETGIRIGFPWYFPENDAMFVDEFLAIKIERFLVDGIALEPKGTGWLETYPETFPFEGGVFVYYVSGFEIWSLLEKDGGQIPVQYKIPNNAKHVTIHYRGLSKIQTVSSEELNTLEIDVEFRKISTRLC